MVRNADIANIGETAPKLQEESREAGQPLWLDDYLPYRVAVAASEIGKIISPYYQHFGLTMPELAILSVLYEASPLTQQMIIARTVMEKFAISRGARALLEKKLIERRAHQTDGRSYWLSITDAGRELYASVVPMSLAFEDRLREALGSEEKYLAAKLVLREVERAAQAIGADARSREVFSHFLKD